jgi:hypothetical protein
MDVEMGSVTAFLKMVVYTKATGKMVANMGKEGTLCPMDIMKGSSTVTQGQAMEFTTGSVVIITKENGAITKKVVTAGFTLKPMIKYKRVVSGAISATAKLSSSSQMELHY